MTIAVDFDGTIVEHRYPEIGEELPFATDVLRRLINDRHKLVLWTVRNGELLQQAVDWCRERGVEFYAVNSSSSAMFDDGDDPEFSAKPNADIFIDDRNIGGLPDWTTIYKIIKTGKTYRQIVREQVMSQFEEQEPPSPRWMFWKR